MNSHLNTFLQYPKKESPTLHQSELQKIADFGNNVWIQLPSNLIQPRYYLNVIEMNFNESYTPNFIRKELLQATTVKKKQELGESISEFFLIAESPSRGLFYKITEYIQESIEPDERVFDRLRGRTVLYIYQTDTGYIDLLSDTGVKEFINETLNSYVEYYGTDLMLGFSIELPEFLSVFHKDGLTIPWTDSFYEYIENNILIKDNDLSTNQSLSILPSLFYESHNSPIMRGIYWQKLTTQFLNCFLSNVKAYCIEKSIHFAVTLPESAKSLQYDLGTLLGNIDYPILISDETNTTRRFVVTKAICSNSKRVGIARKNKHTTNHTLDDASIGFNEWISQDYHYNQKITNTSRYIHQYLFDWNPIRPILLLSPIQSLWMEPDEKNWNKITGSFAWFCDIIWKLGYDFDIVSEEQLLNSVINRANGTITINGNTYQLILLPSCISLHENTVQRLSKYTKSKGKIIVNTPPPYLLNGKIGLAPYQLERLIYGRSVYLMNGTDNEKKDTLRKFLNKWVKLDIRVYRYKEDNIANEVRIHQRRIENGDIFYLYNSAAKSLHTIIEILDDDKILVEIDLNSGETINPEYWKANMSTYYECKFPPKQARLFIAKNSKDKS